MYFFDYNCKSDFNFIVNNFAFQKKFFVIKFYFCKNFFVVREGVDHILAPPGI